ncbi:hypothetical protein AB0L22_28105 [Micromonospora haikouensis]|uniref:hypothetical protein n=1 Tax=Micromonospora haikouensis TaxID=686309 RepID=UPI00341CBD44
MSRRNSGNRPVRVTDLSHEVPSISADENNHSRTRATGLSAELDRANRRIAELEGELKRAGDRPDTHLELLRQHLRRRTRALATAFVTLGAHAGYGMGTSGWGEPQWWLHSTQMLGLLVATGYLIAPNVRRLLRLVSETAGPEHDR